MKRERAKREGKGRSPSPRDLERAARRQGLADQSDSQALDKLRAMAPPRTRVPSTPADLLNAIQQRGE